MNGEDTDVETPLAGIQLPEEPQAPVEEGGGPSADVRLMYYGRNFGEMNHAANYGPDGTELQDHHVAISPNVANQLGLNLHDWVWVGPQLRQYSDVSAITKDRPTTNSVEVRDFPADGRTTLRKATPDEVNSFAPGVTGGRQPLTARQAAAFTGLDPSQITAASVNQLVQPQIEGQSRGLIAGEPTAASYEAAATGGAEQPADVTQYGGADEMGAEPGTGIGTGGGDTIAGDFSAPPAAHLQVTGRDPQTGAVEFNGGAVKYHPNTDSLEWSIAGRTFVKQGDYGKVTSWITRPDPALRIVRDPETGEYQRLNINTGKAEPMPLTNQSPQYSENLTPEQNLARLTPHDRAAAESFANYEGMAQSRFGKMNPEFDRLRAYVKALNPNFDPRNYALQQQTKMQYASGANGSPGQRLTSTNQALIHAATVWDLAKALPEQNLRAANSLTNFFKTETGSPAQPEFEAMLRLFATEVSRAAKGGVPNEGDIVDIMQSINAKGSQAQIQGGIRDVLTKYLEGVARGLDYGYSRTMKEPYPDLISDDAAQALGNLGIHSKWGGRDLRAQQGQATTQNSAEEAAIAELKKQGKLVNPDTVKQAIKIMQGQQ